MADSTQTGHRQRLRDRFAGGAEGSHSEEALLELLLSYALPRKGVQALAAHLLAEYGSLTALLEAPLDKLVQFSGVGHHTAVLIKLVDCLRRHSAGTPTPKDRVAPSQGVLFEVPSSEPEQPETPKQIETPEQAGQPDQPQPPVATVSRPIPKPRPRRGSPLFGKAALKESIHILPLLPDTDSLEDIRTFLKNNLHFNAEQTRQRFASYIIRRMFPHGYADAALRVFARAFPGTRELQEVCLYRFLVYEPLQVEIIEDVILPNLGTGRLSRRHLREYLAGRFPESKSITDYTKAIVDALTDGGMAQADRTHISFTSRQIPLAALAFILHSEFPEPGMYDIAALSDNRIMRAMLWHSDQLMYALYELRNRGLISKVSEIDSVRQFTTRYGLEDVARQLAAEGKQE